MKVARSARAIPFVQRSTQRDTVCRAFRFFGPTKLVRPKAGSCRTPAARVPSVCAGGGLLAILDDDDNRLQGRVTLLVELEMATNAIERDGPERIADLGLVECTLLLYMHLSPSCSHSLDRPCSFRTSRN